MPLLDTLGGAVNTTLPVGVAVGDASFQLSDATGWPDGTYGPFVAALGKGTLTEEKVLVTTRVGLLCSGVTRGYDGTVARSHNAADPVSHVIAATQIKDLNAHMFNAARDDHTQYPLLTGARAFTGDVTMNQAVNAFGSVLISPTVGYIGVVQLRVNAATGLTNHLLQLQVNSVTKARVEADGRVLSVATESQFGAGAGGINSGATYLRVGSEGDAANAYVIADGTTVTNVGLLLRSKGTGPIKLQTAAGTDLLSVTTAGVATVAGGLTVTAGGATVTGNSSVTGTLGVSSTLTVSAGGAAITGNSSVTGTLTVSSALTVSAGGLTVTAGGLTVSAGGAAVTGNISQNGRVISGGTVGYAEITATSASITTQAVVSGLSVTGSTVTGHRYKVTADTLVVNLGASATLIRAAIFEDGVQVALRWLSIGPNSYSPLVMSAVRSGLSAASHTWDFRLSIDANSTNVTAASGQPSWILVQDIGV